MNGTVLRVRGGSHAYGLNTETSDEDFIEVYMEPPGKVLGAVSPDAVPKSQHYGPNPAAANFGQDDVTKYPLRKYLRLAIEGNPSVLESMFTSPLFANEIGYEMLSMREIFVSEKMIPKYRGYMRAQTLRLLGLKGGHSAGKAARRTDASEKVGYDTKYAMHVVRLGYFAVELARLQHLTLPMALDDPRREFLLRVRAGELNFPTVFEEIIELDSQLEGFLGGKLPGLRREPDTLRITDFSVRAHMRYYHSIL